jgi:biopolymer transport protein ExbD
MKSIIMLLSVFIFSLLLGCTSKSAVEKERKLDIILKSDNTIMIENSSYTLASLDSLLKNYDNQTVVTLKPDKDVEMGFIQKVQTKLKSADIDRINYDGNFD